MDRKTDDTSDQTAPAWTRRSFIATMGKLALASGAVLMGIGAQRAEAECNPQPSCGCGCSYGDSYGNPYCCYFGGYVYVITPCYFPVSGEFDCYSVCKQEVCAFKRG